MKIKNSLIAYNLRYTSKNFVFLKGLMFWLKKKKQVPNQYMVLRPQDKTLYFDKDQSILETCIENQIEIDHSCGGNGSCGTCKINILKGLELLGPREDIELEWAEERSFKESERLACQCPSTHKLEFEI